MRMCALHLICTLLLLTIGMYASLSLAQTPPKLAPKMRSFYRVSLFNFYNRSDLDEEDLFLLKQDLSEGLKQINSLKMISTKLGVKITKIGEILPSNKKSSIIDEKGNIIRAKYKGYVHQF